jgi:hypothetical protein
LKFSESGESLLRLIQLETAEKMCSNHKECAIKAQSWLEGTKQLDLARSIHRECYGKKYDFIKDLHAKKRQLERAMADHEIAAIIMQGKIIHTRMKDQYRRNVILGYLPTSSETLRPIHLVLEYQHDQKVVVIVTMYDPRSKNMWTEDFTTKICFCDQD